MIRGRLGRTGFRGVTLAAVCDLVWVEIWDDVSPMADRSVYRDVMVRMFLNGEDPSAITYKGADGKTHRLAEHSTRKVSKDQMGEAKALYERIKAAKTAAAHAKELVSPGDG